MAKGREGTGRTGVWVVIPGAGDNIGTRQESDFMGGIPTGEATKCSIHYGILSAKEEHGKWLGGGAVLGQAAWMKRPWG